MDSFSDKAMPSRTLVDALLLEAWRLAAAYPGDQFFLWLRDCAPRWITSQPIDPGTSRPARGRQTCTAGHSLRE